MMKALRIVAGLALLAGLSVSALAQVAMQGSFTAQKACPALQSIKKGTNPGNVSVAAGQSYKLLGKNKEAASHYWIEVPGAVPVQRWVAIDCGSANGAAAAGGDDQGGGQPAPKTGGGGNEQPFYVLALSWEPAFCEGLPDKTECKAMTRDGFSATSLSLHGLWPQPRRRAFCGVDTALANADNAHRWQDLPEPKLSAETKAALDKVMPGTQSLLERHEWIKHGTCYPAGTADSYFQDAIRVTAAVNASPLRDFFAANIGKTVSTEDLRKVTDQAFGAGAGQRLRVSCKDDKERRLIVELTLGLKGDISSGTPLPELIAAAPATDMGCPKGVIDPAGLQ